jgi:predicted XRE-type DNA-binding protein
MRHGRAPGLSSTGFNKAEPEIGHAEGGDMAKTRRYTNAFEAVGFGPIEAEHLRIRADLMIEVERLIAARRLTQAEAAKLLHVTQPRISDLMRGKIERFSIDTLVEMLWRAGADVSIKVRRRKHAA